MSKRTITLTGRPPVVINEEAWPVIARAKDLDYEGQHEFQSFRTSRWSIFVRQHQDGRAIVYAVYDYDTRWQSERNYSASRGVLLEAGADLVDAINHVGGDIATCDHYGDDADRWGSLIDDCIADLPAEELD